MGTLVLAASHAAADPSEIDPSEWLKETASRTETIGAGDVVRVVNSFGNVYTRFGGYESEVEVLSTHQRPRRDEPGLQLLFTREEGRLVVAVAPVDAASRREPRERIDLVVFVPLGARLEAETGDGEIEIKKLRGDVIARSLAGDLRIDSVEGRVKATTSRGRITANLASGVTHEPQELVTETGDVEVWIGEDSEMEVRLETSGEICTDFSIEIEHRRFEEPGKYGVAKVGRGGPTLRLASKQGKVCLRRLQKNFRTDDGNNGEDS